MIENKIEVYINDKDLTSSFRFNAFRARASSKSKITRKFLSGNVSVMNYLLEGMYFEYFTAEELICLYEGCKLFLKETKYLYVRRNMAFELYDHGCYHVLRDPKKAYELLHICFRAIRSLYFNRYLVSAGARHVKTWKQR